MYFEVEDNYSWKKVDDFTEKKWSIIKKERNLQVGFTCDAGEKWLG